MLCPICKNELIETDDGFVCRECNKKYTVKSNAEVIKDLGGVSSFVCPTCGSREFTEVDGKLKCKCCFNVYDKDEKVVSFANDLSQADNFRQMADFSRAKTIYQKIVDENPDEDLTSAYWGMFLCDNNVIFEADGHGEIFPSFYRVRDVEVGKNENYQKAIDCSTVFHPDKTAQLLNLAEKIEYCRGMYFDIARKSDEFDVFICFKNDGERSSEWAQAIYNRFARKYNVFFSNETLKDIKSSYREYEPNIYYALYTAKVMLVLCKDVKEVNSQWVKNEWYRYSIINKRANMGKAIIPIFIDDFNPDDLPDDLWHIQGLKTGKNLLADLENQLKSVFEPIDSDRYTKEKLDEAERARREKSIELEKELRVSQAKLAEFERLIKNSTVSESVSKIQNQLKILWIKIEEFGSFGEARLEANNIIRSMPDCSCAWLALAYCDLNARTEADFIKNFRYFDNPNFRLAYKNASDEEKKKFDVLRQQYELNNEKSAKELIKSDDETIHNAMLTIKDQSLMEMRSFYNRINTTLAKIDTLDEEYKKYLGEEVEEFNRVKSDVVKLMAENVSDSFIQYSKDNTIDLLDYEGLLNRAESFLPEESKDYFIENCYPTAKTVVETAVSTQTEKFKDIIQQSNDAFDCSQNMEKSFRSELSFFADKRSRLSADCDSAYIKRIRRRWTWGTILYTLLTLLFEVFFIMPVYEKKLWIAIVFGILLGLPWLYGFSEYSKISRKSPLITAESVTLAFAIIFTFAITVSGLSTSQYALAQILLIVFLIALIIYTAVTKSYSPRRRHPKNRTDLEELATRKHAYKYYCKKFTKRNNELNLEYQRILDSMFSQMMTLDHDLGGVALKCKVEQVKTEDALFSVLKCYQQKVLEVRKFFNLAIKQANGVLVKMRKYGR